MYTHKDSVTGKVSYRDYVRQFITPKLIEYFANSHIAKEYDIAKCYEEDEHLNNIPLGLWDTLVIGRPYTTDRLPITYRNVLPVWGDTITTLNKDAGFSLAMGGSILKEIARLSIGK